MLLLWNLFSLKDTLELYQINLIQPYEEIKFHRRKSFQIWNCKKFEKINKIIKIIFFHLYFYQSSNFKYLNEFL
jgi:hypothetical protein